jgi:hypothetical protein
MSRVPHPVVMTLAILLPPVVARRVFHQQQPVRERGEQQSAYRRGEQQSMDVGNRTTLREPFVLRGLPTTASVVPEG